MHWVLPTWLRWKAVMKVDSSPLDQEAAVEAGHWWVGNIAYSPPPPVNTLVCNLSPRELSSNWESQVLGQAVCGTK